MAPPPGKLDKKAILAEHFLLQHLPGKTLDELMQYARVQAHGKNQVIVRKGDAGSGMMAVVSGRVKISTVSSDGREIILDFVNPGEVFGEIALLDEQARTADAVALEPTELLVLERRDFLPFLQRHPNTCLKLLSLFCSRLRQTNALVEDALFLNVESRLAKRLLHFAAQTGRRRPDGILIPLKLPQREIAALIGVTRETVNKQLSAWQERGWVKLESGSIVLTNKAVLEALVNRSL